MKNLGNMMKQAQQMQSRLTDMQNRLSEQEFTGTSGGGMVSVTTTGKHEVKKISIDAKLCTPDDKEMLEDLIVVALNDARNQVESMVADETQKAMGGLSLPAGLKLPF